MIYLYVCYWPGLEDYSSRPGIVSRSSVVLSVEGVLSVEREERKSDRKLRNKASSLSRGRYLLRGEPVSRGDGLENFEREFSPGKIKERA